jgi:peptidoglycan/LPS O-acetylase OafA/YrhL
LAGTGKDPAPSSLYRADVDGLRAVAILSVIAFHAAPGWVPGGFIGVDIFFVISGYLITRQIRLDLEAGTFRLSHFFARRLRRIYPALLVVVSACLLAAWLWLLPGELAMVGRHAAAAVASVANLVFLSEVDYFAPAASAQPLLHLWSLGVEEQFYLLFAVALLVSWRLRPRVATVMLVAVAVLSLAACLWLSARTPVAAFYLPWTRAWQFAFGALLAMSDRIGDRADVAAPGIDRRDRNASLREAAGLAGVLLLAGALARVDERGYPGTQAVVPTLGAALVILAGPRAWTNRRLLAWGPLVAIGLVSYSLYLWHWPLLVFPALAGWGADAPFGAAGPVAVAFVAAGLTHRFVERPVRRQGRKAVVAIVYAAGVVGVTAYYAGLHWIPARSSDSELALAIDAARRDWQFHALATPFGNDGDIAWSVGAGPHRVLFLGDSNAQQYAPRVDELASGAAPRASGVVFAGANGCAPIRGMVRNDAGVNDCDSAVRRALALADNETFSTVLLGAQWIGYFTLTRNAFRESGREFPTSAEPGAGKALASLRDTLRHLRRSGKDVYLVLAIPTGGEFDPVAAVRRSIRAGGAAAAADVVRAGALDRVEMINDRLRRVAEEENVRVVDPFVSLCDRERCRALDAAGRPIYRDASHLRGDFVRTGVFYLDEALMRALTAAPPRPQDSRPPLPPQSPRGAQTPPGR